MITLEWVKSHENVRNLFDGVYYFNPTREVISLIHVAGGFSRSDVVCIDRFDTRIGRSVHLLGHCCWWNPSDFEPQNK